MARTFQSDDSGTYRMDYANPHEVLEPIEKETAVVDEALAVLRDEGVLPHTDYDHARFPAHREAVREAFEIPWTAITPRMQRLLYAVNAIARPANMIAAGRRRLRPQQRQLYRALEALPRFRPRPAQMRGSVNVTFDIEGLEVSAK